MSTGIQLEAGTAASDFEFLPTDFDEMSKVFYRFTCNRCPSFQGFNIKVTVFKS